MGIFKDSTRALLVGIYFAAIIYLLFIIARGGETNPNVMIALIVECVLLYLSIFRKPPNKLDLTILSIIALSYLSVSWILSGIIPFHHTVIMASVGLLLYGVILSEPKFPLTKRALGTGLIVGVIMTFLGIWLALKLGVVFLVGAEMLGAILLSVHGKYTPQENVIVVAIANSSAMISIGVLITFPAIAIFDPANPLFNMANADFNPMITFVFIVIVTGLSAVFGIILLAPFRDRFEHETWPQIQPQAHTINSIGGDAEAKKTVGIGITASAGWTATMKVTEGLTGAELGAFPHGLGGAIPAASAIPDWIGISNSPMMAGIGFFVGWKRALIMGLGSLASVLIWLILEGANPAIMYEQHIKRAEIIYIALGVFVTVIAGDFISGRKKDEEMTPEVFEKKASSILHEEEEKMIVETPHKSYSLPQRLRVKEELFSIEMFKEEVREIVADPRAYLQSRRGHIPPWISFLSISLFIIIGTIIFWFLHPFPGVQIHWLLFIFGAPIVLVSVYFTARVISETGMLAGYISDMIAIPAILLFKVSFAAITTFMSMLGALQNAAIAFLAHLKLGRLTEVRGRDILKAVFIGAMLGTSIGSFITFTLFGTYGGFGGTDLPSPAAQLFGFLVISLQGIGDFQLPGMNQFEGANPIFVFIYLLSFAIAGFLMGRELIKRGLSSMSLVVGVLIPPATAVAILIGGFIDYRVRRQYSPQEPISKAETLQQQTEVQDANYSRMSRILSGIVAGEAVVTVIWVLETAIAAILATF
jgi:hypothetical protein